MANRKHTPELKLLHGLTRDEFAPAPTPRPAAREPDRPAGLSVAERRVWDKVTDELREMGTLAAADTYQIMAYCYAVVHLQRIHDEVSKASALTHVSAESGVMHAHPLLTAYNMALGRTHVLASALGLHPHGRTLIHGRDVDKRPDTELAAVRDLYA